MGKFTGTISELKSIVTEYGLSGTWSEMPNASNKFTSTDGGILLWYPTTKTLQIQGKPESKKTIEALIKHIEDQSSIRTVKPAVVVPQPGSAEQKPKVFVVYGHDEPSRDQLEFILTKLEIDHIILAKSSGNGKTLIEALEGHIGQNGSASIGIVLLTPDDMGYAKKDGEAAIKERARQNVILEMGMLIAQLGRLNTVILVKGDVERPSDTDGIIYLGYKSNVKEAVVKLVERLEEAGCKIDHKKAFALR